MSETDRLAAAWLIVCGFAMAAHGEVSGYHEGTVTILVSEGGWMSQMMSMRGQIGPELGKIAGVPVTAIHFEKKR